MGLRWETDEFGGSGHSGGVRVACYDAGTWFKGRRFRWTLLTSFDAQVEGGADTPEAARAAAEAAWGEWCETAGLSPVGADPDPAEEIRRIAAVCGELSLGGCGIVQYRATFPSAFDPSAPPDTPLPPPEVVEVPPDKVEGIFEAVHARLRERPEYRPVAEAERARDDALAGWAKASRGAGERIEALRRALQHALGAVDNLGAVAEREHSTFAGIKRSALDAGYAALRATDRPPPGAAP